MTEMTPKPPHELMNWRLRLYCGHTVECSRHCSHKTVHSAFTGSVKCTECGRDPATIIDARAVGLVAQPPEPMALPPTPPRKPPRAALERRIQELEAEIVQLKASQTSSPSAACTPKSGKALSPGQREIGASSEAERSFVTDYAKQQIPSAFM